MLERDLRIIGRIRSPHLEARGTPIQPAYARGAEGQVVLNPELAPALDDIEGFERLWLLYLMDRVDTYRLHVVPYRDTRPHGVFATRSPTRPNPLGISVVRLLAREGNVLHVADLDVLDDTPLLDLKPYVPIFDAHPSSRAGWFDTTTLDRQLADERFHVPSGPPRGNER